MGSSEFFYLDDEGCKRDDWLHEEILDNPEADRKVTEATMKRAIDDGVDPELARKMYGRDDSSD